MARANFQELARAKSSSGAVLLRHLFLAFILIEEAALRCLRLCNAYVICRQPQKKIVF